MAKKKAVPKEACTMSEICVSVGSDCTEEGRNARENECFDDGTAKEPVVVDVAPCAELKCKAYNPKLPRNCKVYPPATENGILRCANYKPEQLADDVRLLGESLDVCTDPECIAADGTGEQAAGEQSPDETEAPKSETTDDNSESIPAVPETVTVGGHKTFNRTLPVALSEEELAEHGAELSRLINIWTKAKLDKKAFDKASKKLIDETEEQYVSIAEIVEAGSEERNVPCYWEYDKEHGEKTCYRCDTGDVVEKVNMTLLDYDHEPTVEESIKNVEEAFQTTVQEEAAEPVAGEETETQGDTATEEETPATTEISQDPTLCVCENCGEEATVVPGSECANCIFGKMEAIPGDIGAAENKS